MGSMTSALDVCGTQFNRLKIDGAYAERDESGVSGGKNVVLTCGLVDITRTETLGDERTVRDPNGAGGFAAERVQAAASTGFEYTVVLSSALDAELLDLFALVDRVIDPGSSKTIGFKARDLSAANCDCQPAATAYYGVSMLLWSLAWRGRNQRADYPYLLEAVPKIKFRPGWARQKSAEFHTVELTGDAETNSGWGQGPGDVYPEVAGLGRHYAEFLTTVAWPGGCNCDACDGYVPAATPPVTPIEDAP